MTTTDRPIDEMQTRSRARGLLSHRVVADVAAPVAAAADADSLLTFFSPWQNHVLISQSVTNPQLGTVCVLSRG